MKDLNLSILGFGKMGQIRYENLQNIKRCKVVSVFEINEKLATPKGLLRVKSPEEIFDDRDVDGVVISTSNDKLKDFTVRALQAGKHVFCEKPPGRNLDELQEIVTAEINHPDLKLMFGFNHRHHESVIHAKKLIESREYGDILWLRGRYGKSVDENFYMNWRSKKEIAGGGIFLDQGIHMLDLFLMLCGDFEEVKAFVSNLYWQHDIEDNVFAIFRNKQGQVASLHSTMTQWRHLFSLEIFLSRGYIIINGLKTSSNTYGDEVVTVAKNRTPPPAAMWTDEEKLVFHVDSSWQRELALWIEAIQNDAPISIGNTGDALKVMRLVEKVYQE